MRRRRVVIRHDDDKKGSGCLVGLITICTVVLLCCATIFLFMCVNSYPYTLPKNGLTINLEIVDKIKEAFLKDKNAHETTAETTETTVPAPVIPTVTYKEFFSGNERIQIKYPVLSNMQDLDLQTKINTEIYKNAVAIIDLYPVKSYYLKIDATVDTINEKYLSIIYTGKYSKNRILAMASDIDDDELTKEGEIASENKVYAFSGIGFYPGSNVGAQTGIPQTPAYPGATGLPGTAVPTQPAAGVPGQLPAGANAANAAMLQQQAESLVGILRGLEAGGIPAPAVPAPTQAPKKQTTTTNKSASASNIFYTNCINLTTGKTISVNDICTSNELAEYILSSSVRFINVDPTKVSKIKAEIKKNKKSYYVDMFDSADFSNFEREKWPKSFSYRKGNTLYFSVPVSKTYGDYVIVEYEIR